MTLYIRIRLVAYEIVEIIEGHSRYPRTASLPKDRPVGSGQRFSKIFGPRCSKFVGPVHFTFTGFQTGNDFSTLMTCIWSKLLRRIKKLPGTSHLRFYPRKSLKVDFLFLNSRVDRSYWYHFSSFWIFYRCQDLKTSIHVEFRKKPGIEPTLA